MEDDGLVSQWDDKSGNGNNAIQTIKANKPETKDIEEIKNLHEVADRIIRNKLTEK